MTGRKWLGALTLLSTLICSSSYASGPFAESRALGIVMMRSQSSVMINGAPAITGTTVFRGDVLETRSGSTAVVKLRSGASLALSANSAVALELVNPKDTAEKVNLRRGAINLQAPGRSPEWVTVPGASVLVQGQGSFPAICRIAMVGQSSAIINDRGRVEVRGSGSPLILPVGQYVTLEAGRPQGGSQDVGKVTAAIPAETVQHNGQAAQPLHVQDGVSENDVVQTENTGRVRIMMEDGSLLNIGARSKMRITTHNAQSQQTGIELTAGKLRSQVEKISKQGGSFQVTTQTAVIGVVGTDFIVDAQDNPDPHKRKTLVWCISGLVKVTNLNAAVVGAIMLNAGEFTSIAFGMPPAPAAPASPGSLQAQINQTSVNPPAPGGLGGLSNATRAGVIGASGAGAGMAGVAIGNSNNANTFLTQAGGTLKGAGDALNNASNNANDALNDANNANQGNTNTGGTLTGILEGSASPTYPCGCH